MIAALEEYNHEIISRLISDLDVTGIVLGDLFCDRRMFAGGIAEMYEYIGKLKNSGKKIYIQTKCYMTDRVLSETITMLEYLIGNKTVDGIILQDEGLFSEICGKKMKTEIIWGYMNVSRNRAVNLSYYSFLKSVGDVKIMVDSPKKNEILKKHGIKTILMCSSVEYNTVGRKCYTVYENNMQGKDCGRSCKKISQSLVSKRFNINMSIDGYMLGKEYGYLPKTDWGEDLKNEELILYAPDYDTFKEKMGGGTKQ